MSFQTQKENQNYNKKKGRKEGTLQECEWKEGKIVDWNNRRMDSDCIAILLEGLEYHFCCLFLTSCKAFIQLDTDGKAGP